MGKVFLKKNEERRVKQGHLWIFSNEIESRTQNGELRIDPLRLAMSEVRNGELIEVFDNRNNFIGTGFYNGNSLIAVRMLSHEQNIDLKLHFENLLIQAYELRKSFYPNRNSFRMVFSESDYLPGLIIDKYNDTFVLQVYSSGMEKNIQLVCEILKDKFNALNIFSRNEPYFRKLEGLIEEDSIYLGNAGNEIISDGFVSYKIDFVNTHKTGFYFDQSDNREFLSKISGGKSVLDCFCNSGGFGLHAALGGADSVTFVDSSSNEIEKAKANSELNNLKCKSDFFVDDVFDYLEQSLKVNRKFDIVNIDPPAFAKNKKSLPTAIKGYEKLNRLSMEIINDGGLLLTSSCSHHLKENDFFELINRASVKAGKKIQLIHFNNASKDHPSLISMPETEYLKFAVFKVR